MANSKIPKRIGNCQYYVYKTDVTTGATYGEANLYPPLPSGSTIIGLSIVAVNTGSSNTMVCYNSIDLTGSDNYKIQIILKRLYDGAAMLSQPATLLVSVFYI